MSQKAIRRVELARRAADKLRALGFPKEANDVRSVCVANSTYRSTMALLHRDNMTLVRQSADSDRALIEEREAKEIFRKFGEAMIETIHQLAEFATHDSLCPKFMDSRADCTCGLGDVLHCVNDLPGARKGS